MLQKWEYFTCFQCRWLKISPDLSSCLSLHVLIFKRVDWIWYWKWKKFYFHLSRAILRNWAFFAASLRDLVLGKKTPPEFMVHLKCKICSSKAPVKICWHIFSVAPTKQTEWNTSKLQKKKKVTFDPRKTLQDVHLQFLPLWQDSFNIKFNALWLNTTWNDLFR